MPNVSLSNWDWPSTQEAIVFIKNGLQVHLWERYIDIGLRTDYFK